MIPLIKPDVNFEEVSSDIKTILDSGRLTTGPYVQNFERLFADYVGAKYAVATTSATTALHMALVARGIGPGDEVLVSDFTFPASGNAIVQTGATPVLVDCTPDRFELDFEDAAKKVTPNTKAIMLIHPFGQPVRPDLITTFSDKYGVWTLEDAACAVSSRVGNTRCGVMGAAACFSFHPRKILTTGEGGMITTSDERLNEQLKVLRAHGGKAATVGFQFVENGFNYRMSEIQAALGLAQLKRIDSIVDERRRIGKIYIRKLKGVPGVSIPLSASEDECSFQSFVVMLDDKIDRDRVIARMKAAGVEAMLGTYAMHTHPSFARYGYKAGDLPHSYRAQQQSLTIPLSKGMEEADVDHVVRTMSAAIG